MAEQVLLTSTGLLAGFSASISLVSVPSIVASSDPLPAWQATYNNGSKFAMANILVTTAAGVKCYLNSGADKDYRYLAAVGLASAMGLYTVMFMKKTNSSLFSIKLQTRQDEDTRVRKLVGKWSKLQVVRTLLALGSFATAVYVTSKR